MIPGALTPEQLTQVLVAEGAIFTSQPVIDEFLDGCAELLRDDVRANIEGGTTADGTTVPLAHPRQLRSGPPLLASGDLYNSLVGKGAHHVERRTATSLEFGTSLPYARKMIEGGTTTPTRAKNLTIPLTAAAEGVRAPKFPSALQVMVRGGRAVGLADIDDNLQYAFLDKTTTPPRRVLGFGPALVARIRTLYSTIAEKWFGKPK